MRFKIDENLPIEAAELFSRAGHDALTLRDQQMVGEADPRVAHVCQQESRGLVTLDLDFADIRTYPPGDFCGLIVLRPRTQSKPAVMVPIQRLLPLFETEPLHGNLWIVDEIHLRIREGKSNENPTT